jgi:diadenosine tetraphosphate (Ap4A) HIT family hydrolase
MSNVDFIAPTAIHRFVAEARAGTLARVVARLRSGWAVLGDPQIQRGYCLLYPDPVVADLHLLRGEERTQFMGDIGLLGEAVMQVTGARRINYEMLGNVEPALHAHVIPRYAGEPEARRSQPVWLHDWDQAPRFEPVRDRALQTALRDALASLGALPR